MEMARIKMGSSGMVGFRLCLVWLAGQTGLKGDGLLFKPVHLTEF